MVTTFVVFRVHVSNLLIYLTATSRYYHIEIDVRPQLHTCGISKELLLYGCVDFYVEFSPSLHPLIIPCSLSHPYFYPPTVVAKRALSRSPSFIFSLSPLDTTNHRIDLNEGESTLDEHNGAHPTKSNLFLDWMETMGRQSQFQFDLKQSRRAIIGTVKNLFANRRKRTIQYLIKQLALDMTAWTTLCQENKKRFQQMILYFDKMLKVTECRPETRKEQKKDCQHPVLSKLHKRNLRKRNQSGLLKKTI